jgi:hypothetical protein
MFLGEWSTKRTTAAGLHALNFAAAQDRLCTAIVHVPAGIDRKDGPQIGRRRTDGGSVDRKDDQGAKEDGELGKSEHVWGMLSVQYRRRARYLYLSGKYAVHSTCWIVWFGMGDANLGVRYHVVNRQSERPTMCSPSLFSEIQMIFTNA